MSLSDGDFLLVEENVAAALMTDVGAGGLMDPEAPALAAVRVADESAADSAGQADFPLALVRVRGKKEEPLTPARSALKTFAVRASLFARGGDRETVEASVRRIAARVEQVVRDQNRADQQLLGLADLIGDGEGVLFTCLSETVFPETVGRAGQLLARGRVDFLVQVPCAFIYE